MMSTFNDELIHGLLMYAPALLLCLLGAVITLRSGDVSLGSADGLRRLASNASYLAVRLGFWVLAILGLVELIGAGVLLRSI
jgi:hypothetical protein